MIISPTKTEMTETIEREAVIEALRDQFPDSEITVRNWSDDSKRTAIYSISIVTPSESSFQVTALRPGNGFSIDGLESQDARAAVAIREAWHTDKRIVAVENSGAWFVELVPGMSPEDIINGHRPFSELTE